MKKDKGDKKKKLTLYFDNEEDLNEVRGVAESMGAYIQSPSPSFPPNPNKLYTLLEEIANRDAIKSVIPDPVAWQKDQRTDRELPFRD